METCKHGQYKILKKDVSEELNSVETYFPQVIISTHSVFQKNLIVWKHRFSKYTLADSIKFQKNLIVWKLELDMTYSWILRKVSEELNSVETNGLN